MSTEIKIAGGRNAAWDRLQSLMQEVIGLCSDMGLDDFASRLGDIYGDMHHVNWDEYGSGYGSNADDRPIARKTAGAHSVYR
jgi:hypothetical protein